MDPLTLSAGARLLGVARKYWYVGVIFAMGAALAIQSSRISSRDEALDRAKITQTQLEDRNALVQASLDAAVVRIKDNNLRIEEGARKLEEQRRQADADLARLAERFGATQATIKALEAQSRRSPADACAVSGLAHKALEEL